MYIALKPFRSAGVDYIVDDKVDVSKLNEAQIANLVHKKLIVKTGEDEANASTTPVPELVTIPVNADDGTIEVSMTPEQLLAVIAILQLTAEDAAKAIKDLTEESQLILIHRLDTRKTVKEAAQNRAEALAKAAEEAEAQKNPNPEDNGDA